MPFIQALHANQRRNQAMKRQNPYVSSTTKAQRMAKIASNPRSLAYRNNRQMVLYRQPVSNARLTNILANTGANAGNLSFRLLSFG